MSKCREPMVASSAQLTTISINSHKTMNDAVGTVNPRSTVKTHVTGEIILFILMWLANQMFPSDRTVSLSEWDRYRNTLLTMFDERQEYESWSWWSTEWWSRSRLFTSHYFTKNNIQLFLATSYVQYIFTLFVWNWQKNKMVIKPWHNTYNRENFWI